MWHFALIHARTGLPINDLVTATGRQVKFALNEPTEMQFTIPGRSEAALAIGTLITDVYVAWNDLLLARLRVGTVSDDLDANDHEMSVAAVDYQGLLDRRYAHQAIQYTNQDLTYIAWDLIDYTQRRYNAPGGDWGITRGLQATTGSVTHLVEDGKKIGEAIADVRGLYPEFDYEIDAAKRFNVWQMRGSLRDFALEYGGNVSRIRRSIDPNNYANLVRQSGADGIAPARRMVGDLATRTEGRIEAQEGNTDLHNATVVGWAADAYLQRHSALLPAYEITLSPGAGWDPTKLWLGDQAWIVVRSGRLDAVTLERVRTITIDVGDNGQTDVTIGFGDFQENLLALVRGTPARLEQMNRR
jgi:hypothetical protein